MFFRHVLCKEETKMEFCTSCGKRMVLKRTVNGSILKCLKCNLEKIPKTVDVGLVSLKKTKEPIVVITKEEQLLQTNPTTKIRCPKCENNLAITWQVQTRAGDEGATQFYRCTKCNFTFRLYT